MASKRCIPTRFFKDPDIMNLESKDHQLILVGLVLMADDEGRELAHAKLLSRELDYPRSRSKRPWLTWRPMTWWCSTRWADIATTA